MTHTNKDKLPEYFDFRCSIKEVMLLAVLRSVEFGVCPVRMQNGEPQIVEIGATLKLDNENDFLDWVKDTEVRRLILNRLKLSEE